MKYFIALAFCALLGAGCSFATDWTTSFDAALRQAKVDHKLILLDFSGSDWCPACKLLHSEVFSTDTFKDYANQKYELVSVDFPQTKELPKPLKDQNDALSKKYSVAGYPTVIVLDANGKEQGRITGYGAGSNTRMVMAQLKAFSKG